MRAAVIGAHNPPSPGEFGGDRVSGALAPGLIWCLGVYGSASTWVFNVTRQIVAVIAPGEPLETCFTANIENLQGLTDPPAACIVKTHHLEQALAADWLSARACHILVSIRDPRDCVASLMQYMRQPFANALYWVGCSALQCAQFARDPRALLLRYESGFPDDRGTLDILAARLGGTLSGADRERIFAESRRAAIEAKIASFSTLATTQRDERSGDIVDLDSQWHLHHANRTGEIGRWRHTLSADEAAVIEQRLGSWMRAFGYS
jgi:hypothetical protein